MRRARQIMDEIKKILPEVLSVLGILILLAAGLWTYFFRMPCRIEADCRGRGIDAAQIRGWEEQEKDSYGGIIGMAGWRTENMRTVSSPGTGRQKLSEVTGVYGEADLVYPAKLLSGAYEFPAYTDACILTADLSDALFGSTDTAGELVKAGGELLVVAGVIDRDGFCILKPIREGPIEYAAFRFTRRYQAKARAWQRIGGQ